MPPSTFLRDKPRAEPKLGPIDEGAAEGKQEKEKGNKRVQKEKEIQKEKESTRSKKCRTHSRMTQKADIPIRQLKKRIVVC